MTTIYAFVVPFSAVIDFGKAVFGAGIALLALALIAGMRRSRR